MSTNAEHLARHVRARRDELELSQLDVWQAGGPSNTTLTEIENGRLHNLTRTTARKLDIGLQWETGSARRAWEGGEPTPVLRPGGRPMSSKDSAWLREQIFGADAVPQETKEELLHVLEEQERRRGA